VLRVGSGKSLGSLPPRGGLIRRQINLKSPRQITGRFLGGISTGQTDPLPWGLQLAATYQNIPGVPIAASYTATNAQIAPSLRRNLGQCRGAAMCNGTVTIANLFEPNTEFGERIQQIDIRTNKRFKMRRVRVTAKFDVYNIMNNNVVLAINDVYGPSWQNPLNILSPRLFKFGVQVDY
jgi:hypothetical protein